MAAPRTEFAHAADGDGLIFDWRNPPTSRFAKLGMLVIASVVFIFPLSLVHIKLGKQPVQETQSASVLILTPGNDPMQWLELARANGPFPTRFEPTEWEPSLALVDEVLDHVRDRSIPGYQPRYRDLPSESATPPVPLVVKGARVLPVVAPPEFHPIDATRIRPTPVLYPLSVSTMELPDSSPEFAAEVTAEMASQPWRFLLQISPDGAVLHAVALIGHNTPGRSELADWLQAHRFPAIEETVDRWVAVAVTFQNQAANGIVDP